MSVPDKGREVDLVTKVDFQIALAKTDTKLEGLLGKYLSPLLLKLASPHVEVRNLVLKTCEHVNVRAKGAPELKLPVKALLQQFKDVDNNLVRHMDLQYIKIGIDRLPLSERIDLFPVILKGLSETHARSAQQASSLFSLFVRLLPHVRLPPRGSTDDTNLRAKYDLSDGDVQFLAYWLGKLLLFLDPLERGPGLSTPDQEFLTFNDQSYWSVPGKVAGSVNLSEAKFLGAKFLFSGVFGDAERLIPSIIAAADSNPRISELGQDMLKRALPAADLEDTELIERLFKIYTGSPPQITAARSRLKTRVLNILCKSVEATKHKDAPTIIKNAIQLQSYSLEDEKLKAEAFAFVIWITRVGGEHLNGESLIEEIKEVINAQGWPKPDLSENAQSNKVLLDIRSKAYETVGLLMKSDAKLAKSESENLRPAQLVRWLFTSLAEDTSGSNISLGIESAISNAIVAVSSAKLTSADDAALFEVLHESMGGDQPSTAADDSLQARTVYPALRFANKCFPFSNAKARLLNLLALSKRGARHEIKEEATNGLDPYLQNLVHQSDSAGERSTNASLPEFSDFVQAFSKQNRGSKTGQLSDKARSAGVVLSKNVLFHHALKNRYKPPVIDQHWVQNIESAAQNDEAAISAIKADISETFSNRMDEGNPLEVLIEEAFDLLVSGGAANDSAAEALLALLSFSPRDTFARVTARVAEMQERLTSNDNLYRAKVAHIYGILRSVGSVTGSEAVSIGKDVQSLLAVYDQSHKGVGAEINKAAGALLALSHWLARLYYLGDDTVKQSVSEGLEKISQAYTSLLADDADKTLTEAAAAGLLQLSLFGIDPKLVTEILDEKNSKALEKLKKLALSGNETAVLSFGYISLALDKDLKEEERLKKLIDMAHDLHETRQPEVQFAVGSVFTLLAFGRDSKALVGKMDVDGPALRAPARKQAAKAILDKVLAACKTTKPALRQASAIWLLCLVRDGGHTDTIKENLPACQLAFKALLGDKDSLNQETGSMGLGMVYEQGGKELKGDLIKDLIGTFTETKSTLSGGNVTDETQLFEPGALPTENGQSVTTYKDIINLANEVGDPGLVYRFMSLAANSSIWSSRAAFGRFGLSQVLSDASVDGYLASNPKLYSSLFRYRFDPNPNVQRAMNDIWTALVKDPSSTIDKHFDHIMEDLLKTITGKEWRTRQASCAALGDLIQGRQLQKYEKYLNEIWSQTFKVCDDIKGSVRTAAMALARVLTGIVARTLEGGEASAKTATAMLEKVVPFLLGPSGIEATAKDSQTFALMTLLDIIKKASAVVLRPYIPELVGRLLPLLSSLEPEAANYLHLNADKYKITTQDLDDMRTSAVKASPMMEAIERCLDKLDEDSMKSLVPSLAETAKTVIGLPSKVGVSRVLISLATRRNFLFKPYVAQFITILRNKHVTDRNDTIATSAAAACGYLSRLASDKDILKLTDWSQKKYFTEEDERYRVIAGEVVHALAKYATDRFSALSASILPFIFLAKHDTHDAAAEVFKAAWDESVAGNRAVLLHLKEITALCAEHLDSPRWAIKHAAALTVAECVRAAGTEIAEPDARAIWPPMEKALAAKTWAGKEKVLDAFVLLAARSKLMLHDEKLAGTMRKIIIREAKRNNEAYKPHALSALNEFISTTATTTATATSSETDYFTLVSPIIDEVMADLKSATAADAMDVDSKTKGGASSKLVAHRTAANAVRAMFTSLDPRVREGPELKDDLAQCLAVAEAACEERDREVNEAVLESVGGLFGRVAGTGVNAGAGGATEGGTEGKKGGEQGEGMQEVMGKYVDLVTRFGDAPEQTRIKAVEAAEKLVEAVAGRGKGDGGGDGGKGNSKGDGKGGEVVAKLAAKAKELAATERVEGIKRKWLALA